MLLLAQIVVTSAAREPGPGVLIEQLLARGARAFSLREVDGAICTGNELSRWVRAAVEAARGLPVQLDASLTDSRVIEWVSKVGFHTVVIGMQALWDPALLRWALDLLGPRLVAELNVDGGYLFDPPEGGFGLELADAVRQLHFQGVRHVLIRDVTALEVPLTRLQSVSGNLAMDITYHGPVRTMDDIRELGMLDPRHLRGVVVGAPLYDGSMDVAEASRLAATVSDHAAE